MYLIDHNLQSIGWIHTHPTQTAFLSSVDLHTQYSYQALLKEAVAVVCAPTYGTNKWFRLTEVGMRIVGGCSMDGFHEHSSKSRLFHPALNVSFWNGKVNLINLRDGEGNQDQPDRPQNEDGTTNGLGRKTDESANEGANKPNRSPTVGSNLNPHSGSVHHYSVETVTTPSNTASPTETSRMTASKLRNLSVRIEKMRSHRWFLAACIREKLVPRGFHLKWSSHYKEDDITDDILRRTSQDLVAACHRLAGRKLAALKQTFESGWRHLASSLHSDDLDRLSNQLSGDRIKIRGRLQRTKLGKLADLRSKHSTQNSIADCDPVTLSDVDDDDNAGCAAETTGSAGAQDQSGLGEGSTGGICVAGVGDGPDGSSRSGLAHGESGCDHGRGDGSRAARPYRSPMNDESVEAVRRRRQRGRKLQLPDKTMLDNGPLQCNSQRGTKNESDLTERVTVTNLSDRALTADQLTLLSKGLGFVPVRAQQVTRLISELREWERLVRLKEYWAGGSRGKVKGGGVRDGIDDRNTECSDVDRDLRYKKSRWTPEKGRDPWLDLYIEEVKRSVLAGVSKHKRGNLSKGEEKAFLELMMDDSIIIRPADKGSGVVVMNTEDYWDKLYKELKDSSTYRPTEGDETQKVYKKVKNLADRLYRQGYIGKHLHRYLVPTLPRAGSIQGNPKLHKEGAPLRVIISGRGHATEGIAELAEKELGPHVENQPSFVRDTTDFINKVKDIKLPISDDFEPILFCMDVSKLYPSVPREEGLRACKKALDTRRKPDIPTGEVLEMIKIVLDNNNFCAGGSKHYIQINGTAIGSKLGRNYACTYLGEWESELLRSSYLKPFLYLRYIDDIFGIWVHGEESLKNFHQLANNVNKHIKLDLRHSTKSIEFLDVEVRIKGDSLCTDVYTKPTDTKAYLHFTSDHPEHTKSGIPSGLAMRAKRICSSKEAFDRQVKDIGNNLRGRGYPENRIGQGLKRVEGMHRSTLLKSSVKKEKEGVPLVVTYSSHLPNINKILREKSNILSRSETLKSIFSEGMFVSYKRGTNLGDLLVHRKTKKSIRTGQKSLGSCGKDCCVCKVMYSQTDKVMGPGRKTECTYDKSIGCRSRNVVYGVMCAVCECVVYVGETGGIFYQRVQNHLSTIRCGRTEMEVAAHFISDGHRITDAKFIGLEKVWKNWTTYRRVREQRWIGLLGTHQSMGTGGLNKKTA